MNTFDAVVAVVTLLAIAIGFTAGLLRSLAAILAYLIAAPIAVALTPRLTPLVLGQVNPSSDETWIALFVVFLGLGLLISALLRALINELAGDDIGVFDRLAGAVLGAARIFLVAVLIVVVFDRLIPDDRQPGFLVGSKLRPYLSAAGRTGLQSLPPDIADYIDRIKRDRGL
ncbi:MAG TPA: CvpA family protein [Xanthobacteraceae bacterium]|jgi:membrane protein required for colicin V production|nr:CvpA family protein [Xanthobacteraceae bacterium]